MSDEEVEIELRLISEIAAKQIDGAYTTQSDARQALELIKRMALVLMNQINPPGN